MTCASQCQTYFKSSQVSQRQQIYSTLVFVSVLKSIHTASASSVFSHGGVIEEPVSFHSFKITRHFFGESLKTNGVDLRPSQCCSGDSTRQMVVRLTSVLIVMMAMMMTIIAPAADDDCSCRWGTRGGGNVCMCVSMQTPECLGNPQRKGPSHRTSLLQGPLPAADPLISGNKGGRVSNSSKIARGVGGVEGCRGSDAVSHIACVSSGQSQLKKRST